MNNKSIKKIVLLLVTLIVICIFNNTSKASDDSYLYMDNLYFDVTVNKDGSMDVIETWDINIEDTNTIFKTFKLDSSRFSEIKNVKVTDITDGAKKPLKQIYEEMYHVTDGCYYGLINHSGDFEIAWATGLEYSEAKKIYEVSYTVVDAISKNKDMAELYWQFVGEDFEINIENITGKIRLPEKAELEKDIRVWGHTEELNGDIHVTDLDEVEFNVYGRNSGRFVETRILFPSDIITSSGRGNQTENILNKVIDEETIWANEANARRERKEARNKMITSVTIIICLVLSVFLLKKSKDYSEIKASLTKIIPSMKMDYFRELPRDNATPSEAVYIKDKLTGEFTSDEIGKIFSATLLNLSLKKYISFEINNSAKKEEINIVINNLENSAELAEDERLIFEFVAKASESKNSITVKELKKYISKSTTKVIKLKENLDNCIIKSLEKQKIRDAFGVKQYGKYCGISVFIGMVIFITIIIGIFFCADFSTKVLYGIVPLLITEIIFFISVLNVTKKINVYTQAGIDEKEKWKGLKKYMEDFSMLDKREIPELALWEHFLVYATAFGIADKVLKQLKIVYPNMDEMISTTNYSALYFATNTNFSSGFSNSIATAMSSTYSSGTGGGGGFSGGGGGGRRPEVAVVADNLLLQNLY